ncbi:hypothetical protein [Azorhizobium sp. AG788]|uniref:hypothetical protein n=1 Tax=Azorhizobium sp. AG788 TaxID=2183897 RepID=UPI001FE02DCD|nr:hypothetical protein [Azorhizobium sp. AG788]
MTAHATPRKPERALDDTLKETFPASDPPAPGHFTGAEDTPDTKPAASSGKEAESDLLDEALEDTFPASDPPAITIKHGKDDADPRD